MFDKFREECGVFGIYGHSEAAKLAYLGLYALQHRGQESAGIATADGIRIRAVREMGYVNEIFDQETLATLPGHVAIGHTRYSTAGESKLVERAANRHQLRPRTGRRLPQRQHRQRQRNQATGWSSDGSIFQTNSDTEVLVHLYARSQAGPFDEALRRIDRTADGRFFVRDADEGPSGRSARPAWLPAARARQARRCVGRLFGDLRAGSDQRHLCPRRRTRRGGRNRRRAASSRCGRFRRRRLSHCVFEHVYFARPDSEVFGQSVNEVRTNLGRLLARETGRRGRRRRSDSRLRRVRGDRLRRRSASCRCGSG